MEPRLNRQFSVVTVSHITCLTLTTHTHTYISLHTANARYTGAGLRYT